MKVARIYMRVSSQDQNIDRQRSLIAEAKAKGFYVAGVYEESASGATRDRIELNRLLNDLQVGDVVIAENIDRITRLPLEEAESLLEEIKSKGAKICVPGYFDIDDLLEHQDDIGKIILEAVQKTVIKILLKQTEADYILRRDRQQQGIDKAKKRGVYTGRKPNTKMHAKIEAMLNTGSTVAEVKNILGCSESLVRKVRKNLDINNQQGN